MVAWETFLHVPGPQAGLISSLLAWHHPPSLTLLEVKIPQESPLSTTWDAFPPLAAPIKHQVCLQVPRRLFAPIQVLTTVPKALLQYQMTGSWSSGTAASAWCTAAGLHTTHHNSFPAHFRLYSGEVRSHSTTLSHARPTKYTNSGQ